MPAGVDVAAEREIQVPRIVAGRHTPPVARRVIVARAVAVAGAEAPIRRPAPHRLPAVPLLAIDFAVQSRGTERLKAFLITGRRSSWKSMKEKPGPYRTA